VALDTRTVGRLFEPHHYAVGREKIREFARATGERDPRHIDLEAARAAGHPDLVAPPMFAVVYCAAAIEQALMDPDVGIDFAMLVHGGQEFEWGPLVIAGDEIATQVRVAEIRERIGMAFYVFVSSSTNQRGEVVCGGTWTQIVRPRA
jgi:acyl dehydratase